MIHADEGEWAADDPRNVDRFDIPSPEPESCPNCGVPAPTVIGEAGLPVCGFCSWREGAW